MLASDDGASDPSSDPRLPDLRRVTPGLPPFIGLGPACDGAAKRCMDRSSVGTAIVGGAPGTPDEKTCAPGIGAGCA